MYSGLQIVVDGEKWKICAIGNTLGNFLQKQRSRTPKETAKLLALLEHTAQHGPPKNIEKCRLLGDGLYEFKACSLRVIWFWEANCLILCTHGFVKKSQKTPQSEIERARKIRMAYFRK